MGDVAEREVSADPSGPSPAPEGPPGPAGPRPGPIPSWCVLLRDGALQAAPRLRSLPRRLQAASLGRPGAAVPEPRARPRPRGPRLRAPRRAVTPPPGARWRPPRGRVCATGVWSRAAAASRRASGPGGARRSGPGGPWRPGRVCRSPRRRPVATRRPRRRSDRHGHEAHGVRGAAYSPVPTGYPISLTSWASSAGTRSGARAAITSSVSGRSAYTWRTASRSTETSKWSSAHSW